jgi:hypothetical protein
VFQIRDVLTRIQIQLFSSLAFKMPAKKLDPGGLYTYGSGTLVVKTLKKYVNIYKPVRMVLIAYH